MQPVVRLDVEFSRISKRQRRPVDRLPDADYTAFILQTSVAGSFGDVAHKAIRWVLFQGGLRYWRQQQLVWIRKVA